LNGPPESAAGPPSDRKPRASHSSVGIRHHRALDRSNGPTVVPGASHSRWFRPGAGYQSPSRGGHEFDTWSSFPRMSFPRVGGGFLGLPPRLPAACSTNWLCAPSRVPARWARCSWPTPTVRPLCGVSAPSSHLPAAAGFGCPWLGAGGPRNQGIGGRPGPRRAVGVGFGPVCRRGTPCSCSRQRPLSSPRFLSASEFVNEGEYVMLFRPCAAPSPAASRPSMGADGPPRTRPRGDHPPSTPPRRTVRANPRRPCCAPSLAGRGRSCPRSRAANKDGSPNGGPRARVPVAPVIATGNRGRPVKAIRRAPRTMVLRLATTLPRAARRTAGSATPCAKPAATAEGPHATNANARPGAAGRGWEPALRSSRRFNPSGVDISGAVGQRGSELPAHCAALSTLPSLSLPLVFAVLPGTGPIRLPQRPYGLAREMLSTTVPHRLDSGDSRRTSRPPVVVLAHIRGRGLSPARGPEPRSRVPCPCQRS